MNPSWYSEVVARPSARRYDGLHVQTPEGRRRSLAVWTMPRLAPIVLLFALTARPAGQGGGGQSQRPTFRADVNLVRVDVIVTDIDGRQVRGLTAQDFEILDGGTVRTVSAFSEVTHDAALPPPISSVPGTWPATPPRIRIA
jgi:hypothetical protein